MGQYHIPVNIDKREYINPHLLNGGLKMLEWGSGGGTTIALTVLLACSHNRGGGDLRVDDTGWDKVCGRWAGDRIIVLGDYTEPGDPGTDDLFEMVEKAECVGPSSHPYDFVCDNFTDISMGVRQIICLNDYVDEWLGELPDYMMSAAEKSVVLSDL